MIASREEVTPRAVVGLILEGETPKFRIARYQEFLRSIHASRLIRPIGTSSGMPVKV